MNAPESAAVTPGQAALADAWEAQALKCDEAAGLSYLPSAARLEQSTFAAQLRDCARQLRAAIAARQPQPAPGPLALQLIIAVDALRDIADEPHAGYGPVRAAKALDDIGTPGFTQPQPAPELAATKPDLGTAWRLLNETRERLNRLAAEFAAATENDSIDGYTRGSLYTAIRAEMLHQAAGRIREALEGK